MSWASDRLNYLSDQFSYSEINKLTSIPSATISYVINEQRPLPNKYRNSLRNAYQREAYSDLREIGLSSTQARRFSWYAPTKVYEVISEITDFVNGMASSRFDQYKAYLEAQGLYYTDDQITDLLRTSIENAISKSDLPEERLAVMAYTNTSEL